VFILVLYYLYKAFPSGTSKLVPDSGLVQGPRLELFGQLSLKLPNGWVRITDYVFSFLMRPRRKLPMSLLSIWSMVMLISLRDVDKSLKTETEKILSKMLGIRESRE
jgi:hypothetical protein